MYKKCIQCSLLKNKDEFVKDKSRKDGLNDRCNTCRKIINSSKGKHEQHFIEWLNYNKIRKCTTCNRYLTYDNFHRKINNVNNLSNTCKQCKIIIDSNAWELNKVRKTEKHKQWIENNKNCYIDYHAKYRNDNKNKIQEYCLGDNGSSVRRKYANKYYHSKKKFDLKFKLSDRISGALRFRLKKAKNNKHWESILGYSYKQLKDRLESTLPNNISWNDFLNGNYHIDHIIPLSFFEYKNQFNLDFIFAWRLENLRIISDTENLTKSANIGLDIQKPLLDEFKFFKSYPDMYRV